MIMFASEQIYPFVANKGYEMMNLCSPISIGNPLNNLMPPPQIIEQMRWDDNQFELNYIGWVLRNPASFLDFMSIMMGEYYHTSVVVFYHQQSLMIECIVDCLIKLIRERYGIRPIRVIEFEDLINIEDSAMTPTGTAQFMIDKEFYTVNTADPDVLMKTLEEVEEYNAELV